jgi:hypothetical protein
MKRNRPGFPRGNLREHGPNRYFVPSFSVRRSVALDEEHRDGVVEMLRDVKEILGKGYDVLPPSDLGMTTVNKTKFIERMREADARPNAHDIRSLALATRDGLARLLGGAPEELGIPTGKVDRFGSRNNAIGVVPRGWKGYRARYALEDDMGERLPLGAITTENQYCIGVIATAMADNNKFIVDGLARTPHITLANRKRGGIPDHEKRVITAEIEEALPEVITLTDPIIYLRAERRCTAEEEVIYVRDHSAEPPDLRAIA